MRSSEAQRASARKRYQERRRDPAFVEERRAASRRWHEQQREQRRQAELDRAAAEAVHPSGFGHRCERCDGQIVEVYGELKCVQCSRSPERVRAEQQAA